MRDDFMHESLRIEGIMRDPTMAELQATRDFLMLPKLSVADVERLVDVYAPGHLLRRRPGMNVRVGNYIAPEGGPIIEHKLEELLNSICEHRSEEHAWRHHVGYELLHPFTDGNGRSGRTIWLWQMNSSAPLGFLHHFYYQTLEMAE